MFSFLIASIFSIHYTLLYCHVVLKCDLFKGSNSVPPEIVSSVNQIGQSSLGQGKPIISTQTESQS